MPNHNPNAQLELDSILSHLEAVRTPTLLLHCCCAPCSSYVLEYLNRYFAITLFYYNPNISPKAEYDKRYEELVRLAKELPTKKPFTVVQGPYDNHLFIEACRGLEHLPEGGERCARCYELRLRKTAELCLEKGLDYFTTTLSISPYKNAGKLNQIGRALEAELGVTYLPADFKKRGGYQRSIALSAQYGLYRQNYCGCIFSQQQREAKE